MGLPLYIAPVESDLARKGARKSSATASPRSPIRRQDRRRLTATHQVLGRQRLNNGSIQVSTMSNSQGQAAPPWLDNGFSPEPQYPTRNQSYISNPNALRLSGPFHDVSWEMIQSDDRRRQQFEPQTHSLFASDNQRNPAPLDMNTVSVPENRGTANRNGLWGTDSQSQVARPGQLGSLPSRFDRDEEDQFLLPGDTATPVESSSVNPRQSTITQTRSPIFGHSTPQPSARGGGPVVVTDVNTRNSQPGIGLNGLGDRDRSLSPEGWGTLLTTLAPDPQAPSAGSSFAATVASQSAGNSSRTSLTAPDSPVANATDQACETEWDHSDTDESAYEPEHNDYATIHRRGEEVRRVRMAPMRVPDYNLDGPVDGPVDNPPSRRGGRREAGISALRRGGSDGHLLATREVADAGAVDLPDADGPLNSQLQRPRHGWVGHLSVGASDDEQNTERQRLNRESSTASGANAHLGGEEWQRIVRSLARREDIPDEWWAEAGLSRTLPRDATEESRGYGY